MLKSTAKVSMPALRVSETTQPQQSKTWRLDADLVGTLVVSRKL